MRINKHDTNGTKPLLGKGELGYDDYAAGGDTGRVYVGTGTENIPVAKKIEVDAVDGKADAHIARVDNPHGVTKAQVGLGLVDNTADANKNVLSATKWTTARTITLSGDVAGSASMDGTANVSITTTVQPNSVALGTDTTGNYVAGITQGTGITVSGTAGEGWSPTIAITNVGTAGTYTKVTTNAQGQVTSGTTLSATDIPSLDASKITTGTLPVVQGGTGVTTSTGTGSVVLSTSPILTTPNIGVATGTSFNSITGLASVAPLVAGTAAVGTSTLTARQDHVHPAQTSVTGNAGTATKLTTARTISLTGDVTGSVSFDGSADASISATIAANSVALGTDTTGNYVAGVTAGQGITISGTAGEGWSPTIALSAMDLTLFPTSNFKKSVKVATTANITLSGVQTIDGISVVAGDRVLVKDQTTASQNGIYIVNASTWTRSVAADGSSEIASAVVGVDQGTTNGGRFFTNTFKTTDTVGTTAMPWYEVATTSSTVSSANTLATARTVQTNLGSTASASFNGSANITPGVTGILPVSNGGTGATTLTGLVKGNGTSAMSVAVAGTDYVVPSGSITGNASTATTLQTARTISGVSFNGSANIDIEDRLGTAIASAATTTIGTRGLGDYIHITGTTTITSFGTAAAAGVRRTLIFDGALTLTHNATSLICPGAADIVTVAGTIIEVVAETTANWRVVSITHPSLSMAELSYLDGVTSAIQTQLNAKAALASPALTGTPTAPTAASTVSSTQIATTAFAVPRTSTTGSARLPVGTTAQRDASPVDGMIRYNSTTMGFEGYFNGQWQSVGGGQMFGNAIVKAVSYNAQTISENITVTAGLNAYSVGDITINNGYTMTIENGSVYKIL